MANIIKYSVVTQLLDRAGIRIVKHPADITPIDSKPPVDRAARCLPALPSPPPLFVKNTDMIKLMCSNGHIWKVIVDHAGDGCKLCKILARLRQVNNKIYVSLECSIYTPSRKTFKFICDAGHRFYSDMERAKYGCFGCSMVVRSRQKHGSQFILDPDAIIVHKHSRLRFHCTKLRHDPFCTNSLCAAIREQKIVAQDKYDPSCTNFISCGQDFYATQHMIHTEEYIHSCDDDHVWRDWWEIISAVRIFETYFDAKFDDILPNESYLTTGYNEDRKIAFMCGTDKKFVIQCKPTVEYYCADNGINFIFIPKQMRKTKQIATFVFNELHRMGVIDTDPAEIIQSTCDRLHKMEEEHKLFTNRILLSDDSCESQDISMTAS